MSASESGELLQRLEPFVPNDPKAQSYWAALKESVRLAEDAALENAEQLAQYQEAYQKLTAPANRAGVFLKWLPESNFGPLALVGIGDDEYVCLIDPNVVPDTLSPGIRVRLSESFAILGVLPPADLGAVHKVADAHADGRLRLGGDQPGGDSRLVARCTELKDARIEPSDEIRLDATGRFAIEHFPRQESKDYFVEDVPEIEWADVGGQEEAIRLIRETIEQPLLHPELFEKYDKRPPKGILLYGPPGCGKTLIGKATAYNLTREYAKRHGTEVKECFLHISGPKILNMWLGETERMVREIFRTARAQAKDGKLVFIFMDEAESVLRTRSSGRWLNISNTVVPQFCAELDGLVALDNVVLMLTSNRPDYIDPAILRPERIDRKVKVGRPDKDSAKKIMAIYLHDRLPLDPAVVQEYLGDADCARCSLVETAVDYLWEERDDSRFLKVSFSNASTTTLYWRDLVSGALLKSIVDRAKDAAIRRAIADPKVETGIGREDLLAAIRTEYQENEIFPKSDAQEDWLKLLDFEPENVTAVRPIDRKGVAKRTRQGVV